MKINSLIIAIVSATVLLSSCINDRISPSGQITVERYDLNAFDKLDVSHAFDVEVRFSETERSIEIEANENLHRVIEVKNIGNTLRVGLKDFTSIRGRNVLRAYIVTDQIESYEASGAASIQLIDPHVNTVAEVELSGASDFLGEIIVDDLEVDASGAAKAEMYGTATSANISVSGASKVKDYDLVIQDLDIDLSGASEAYLTAQKTIQVDGSGASTLYYKGEAVIEKESLSGGSSIKKRG